jgi:hypothetical protein
MKRLMLMLMIVCCQIGYSQGCVVGEPSKVQKYVCYDGRTLKKEFGKFIWHARRGCFKSTVPCCSYQADHYAYSPNPGNLAIALFRYQENYPFHLGEMQTR